MNWRLRWLLWALSCSTLVLFSFGWLEHAGWDESHTLSRAAAELPRYGVFILGWIVGGLTCGLAVHFWWHWAPPDKKGDQHGRNGTPDPGAGVRGPGRPQRP